MNGMQKKNLIIAAGALLLAVFLLLALRDRSGNDEDVANQLARQEQQVTAVPKEEVVVTGVEITPDSFQLTRRLMAERDVERNSWFVTARETSSFMELPFVPPTSGSVVDDIELKVADDGANPGFLGADACRECHQEKHSGFIHTAHHNTSGVVGTAAMHGHFSGPASTMRTSDPMLSFTMFQQGDKYIQQASFADYKLDFPLNVFTGSAKTGQTFLYWHQDELFQAFVSYLTALDEWIPSPGYTDRTVDYSRRIKTECLECHVTYIEQKRPPNLYKPETAVWGISCERCHGPGRDHVEYHRAHPDEKTASHIMEPSDLPRARQLDICGQCHSGAFEFVSKAFEFRPGDELASFHRINNPNAKGVGGIHTSNQLTRLSMSKCFSESQMTCTSCHNPHVNQRGTREPFTASCLICHEVDHCGMAEKLGPSVADNCVDCHMPVGDNENMTLRVAGGSFTVRMIDHYIRVDEKATTDYLSK